MTLADDLFDTVYEGRAIAGDLGFRPHSVTLVISAYSEDHPGAGSRTDTETPIAEFGGQPPRVRWLNGEELAVGNMAAGTIEIGPITPEFPGGGTPIASLNGSELSAGQSRLLRITGPNHPSGALYEITNITADRTLRFMLKAKPLEESV